jgi:hypothetical protein
VDVAGPEWELHAGEVRVSMPGGFEGRVGNRCVGWIVQGWCIWGQIMCI